MQHVAHTKQMKVSELKRLFAERWNYPPALKRRKIKYIGCSEKPKWESKEPCWQHPLNRTLAATFGPCWDYGPASYKRHPLPAPCRGAVMPQQLLVPTFEHCQSLYTPTDFKLEQCVHEQILFIQHLFVQLDKQLKAARPLQIRVAEQMRYQATRYRILTRGGCCIKIYPELLSQLAEERALCEFQKGFNLINESNCDLGNAVMVVHDALPELRRRIDLLDRTQQSPFLLGDGYGMPSLETVHQMIEDLYSYFFGVVRKLKCWAQLIDAGDEFSIEDYIGLLHAENDFESLMQSSPEKCTCKRCDNKNPLKSYMPCWCQPHDVPAKRQPIYRCDVKIAPEFDSSDSDFVEPASSTSQLVAAMQKNNEIPNRIAP